jgi:hypothetical protein
LQGHSRNYLRNQQGYDAIFVRVVSFCVAAKRYHHKSEPMQMKDYPVFVSTEESKNISLFAIGY